MKFLSFFSSNRVSPLWQYSADATVWRIMFSHNGIIIGEDRNTENKTVSFFCLNASNGRVLWKHTTFEEPWWIGLSGVTSERLYLHGFKKPDMPEQKNIIAADLSNGTVVWKNTDCAFLALKSPHVFGYRDLFERRLYYRLDDRTGELLEEMNELPDDVPENGQYEKTDFTFSRQATQELDTELWPLLTTEQGFVSADIISTPKYHVLNTYQKNLGDGRDLKNSLSIIDTATKKKVYSDVLNGSTAYAVPDSFFMDGHRVYYIKERKTFVALDLPM
ncbi:MAG: DUF4905 domain-containing protein [Bacteroidetes bacterium]|nr:DUF4905 domain-containing protein [Bacteroidota bacterium]